MIARADITDPNDHNPGTQNRSLELEPHADYSIADLPDRIAEKITVDPAGGCWIWIACTDTAGYGRIKWNGRDASAHRLTFHLIADNSLEVFPGRRGDALTLDHLCRVRRCVNPAHLEEVSNRENSVRGCTEVNGTSGYVGVGWHKVAGKWEAQIQSDGRKVHLGLSTEEVDAAHAYDAACIVLGVSLANFSRNLVGRPPTEAEITEAAGRLDRLRIDQIERLRADDGDGEERRIDSALFPSDREVTA